MRNLYYYLGPSIENSDKFLKTIRILKTRFPFIIPVFSKYTDVFGRTTSALYMILRKEPKNDPEKIVIKGFILPGSPKFITARFFKCVQPVSRFDKRVWNIREHNKDFYLIDYDTSIIYTIKNQEEKVEEVVKNLAFGYLEARVLDRFDTKKVLVI